MKFLAMFLSPLTWASMLYAQAASPPPNHPAILPKAEFHTGETARFTITGTVNVQPSVNPRLADAALAGLHPRQYRLEGAMVATFLGMPSGQVLSGTLRFENLRVRDWVSESDVNELISRLQQMEANSWIISRDLTFAGTRVVPRSDPYASDLTALLAIAQLMLIPQMGDQPLVPGGRENISRPASPDAIIPGAPMHVIVEYVADVRINQCACAEFRLTTALPLQQLPSPPEWAERLAKAGVRPLSRASSETAATYLYDAESHAFIFLHLQSSVNVRIEAESGDANALVRIPVTLVTHSVQTAFNSERVVKPPSSVREADLAAFEKHIELASTTGSEATADNGNPTGEVSLGDLARKTRAQNEGQGKQSKEITLEGSSPTGAAVPPGFKSFTYPHGGMTALLPDNSRSVPADKEGTGERFAARVGNPPVVVVIVMGHGPPPPGEATMSSSMNTVLQGLAFGFMARLTSSNDITLGDRPAKIAEFIHEKTPDTPSLRGLATVAAASDGKSLGAMICASSESDYPVAESACHTIVESMRVP